MTPSPLLFELPAGNKTLSADPVETGPVEGAGKSARRHKGEGSCIRSLLVSCYLTFSGNEARTGCGSIQHTFSSLCCL